MRTYDFAPLFRSTIGFDRLFDLAETAQRGAEEGYPPYNIERLAEDRYLITLAVAGFSPDEISITAEQNVVTIEGGKTEKTEREFLYRGISTRHFKRQFNLADYVQVKDAAFDNGLLKIELVREIPEAMKPRRIAINGAQPANVHQIEVQGGLSDTVTGGQSAVGAARHDPLDDRRRSPRRGRRSDDRTEVRQGEGEPRERRFPALDRGRHGALSREVAARHRGAVDVRHPALHLPAAWRCAPLRAAAPASDRAPNGGADRDREKPGQHHRHGARASAICGKPAGSSRRGYHRRGGLHRQARCRVAFCR